MFSTSCLPRGLLSLTTLEEKQTKNTMLFYGKMNLGSFDTIVAYIQTDNNLKYIMPIQSNASMIGLEQCKLYDANVFLP